MARRERVTILTYGLWIKSGAGAADGHAEACERQQPLRKCTHVLTNRAWRSPSAEGAVPGRAYRRPKGRAGCGCALYV